MIKLYPETLEKGKKENYTIVNMSKKDASSLQIYF